MSDLLKEWISTALILIGWQWAPLWYFNRQFLVLNFMQSSRVQSDVSWRLTTEDGMSIYEEMSEGDKSALAPGITNCTIQVTYSCDTTTLLNFVWEPGMADCPLVINARSSLLCPLTVKLPTDYDVGKSVCILNNDLNTMVQTSMANRFKNIVSNSNI